MASAPSRKMQRSSTKWLVAAVILLAGLGLWHQRAKHGSTAKPRLKIETDPLQADCGTWQADYIQLHKDILSGKAPQRLAVSVSLEAGTADRIAGIMSIFYYALLSRRAFQMTTYAGLPGFELAYDSPYIDWLRPPDSDAYLDPLKLSFNGQLHAPMEARHFGPEVDTTKNAFFYFSNNDYLADHLMVNSNMSNMPEGQADRETIFMASNRARTVRMFDNPHHGDQLRAMGLRPETAFTCAFRFLFREKSAVNAMFMPEFEQLARHSEALKIGINIRVGEIGEIQENGVVGEVFKSSDFDLEYVSAYFNCAKALEAKARPGQPVVYYLISDSLGLRQKAKQKYGDQVITNTDMQIVHPNCVYFEECRNDANKKAEAIQAAAGQLATFAMTDLQVITMSSGFGRVGAWLSRKQDNIYSIGGAFAEQGQPRDCSAPADSIQESAGQWAGV